jgi:glycosyltransferase involved in cell wall biosynthesis
VADDRGARTGEADELGESPAGAAGGAGELRGSPAGVADDRGARTGEADELGESPAGDSSDGGPRKNGARGGNDGTVKAVTIGWLGTSKNLYYLNGLTGAMKELMSRYPHARFSVISNGKFQPAGIDVENLSWSLEAEGGWLRSIDVGIMPLEHDDWSKGKCAFKLLQYMAAGLPTVSSPVGMNAEVIQDGVNGLLADSEMEWAEKLSALIEAPQLREDLGNAGRCTVEEKYSLGVCLKRLERILEATLG